MNSEMLLLKGEYYLLYVDMSNGGDYLKYPYWSQATSEFLETEDKFKDETLLHFFHPLKGFVICGINQNVYAEVNFDYLEQNNITLMRRHAGGGAVYVDPGNLTYDYIDTDRGNNYQHFDLYARTALKVLHRLGVPAVMNGRNDLTVNGKKFSGMSSARIGQRFSCGGTLMIDVNLDAASAVLHPLKAKLKSKGVQSVHSRVTNIRQYFKPKYRQITYKQIRNLFLKIQFGTDDLKSIPTYTMKQEDWERLARIAKTKYGTQAWIYGTKQHDDYFHARHFAGLGTVEFSFSVKNQLISHIKIYGDFSLASGDLQVVERNLVGVPFVRANIIEAFKQSDIPHNMGSFTAEDLADLMLDKQYAEDV